MADSQRTGCPSYSAGVADSSSGRQPCACSTSRCSLAASSRQSAGGVTPRCFATILRALYSSGDSRTQIFSVRVLFRSDGPGRRRGARIAARGFLCWRRTGSGQSGDSVIVGLRRRHSRSRTVAQSLPCSVAFVQSSQAAGRVPKARRGPFRKRPARPLRSPAGNRRLQVRRLLCRSPPRLSKTVRPAILPPRIRFR